MVARSNTESEYRALSHIACEIMWLRSLIHELHLPIPSTPLILCGNLSATALAYNPIFHARTKHIKIDAHLISDQVFARQLDIRHIASHE